MYQMRIDDITESRHGGNQESVDANYSIEDKKAKLRSMVLAYVKAQGGATSDEVEQGLGLSHQTVSARMTELKVMGLLQPSGVKRPTRSGRKAMVLV